MGESGCDLANRSVWFRHVDEKFPLSVIATEVPFAFSRVKVADADVVNRHRSVLNEAVEIFLATANVNAHLMRDKTVPFMVQFAHEIIGHYFDPGTVKL